MIHDYDHDNDDAQTRQETDVLDVSDHHHWLAGDRQACHRCLHCEHLNILNIMRGGKWKIWWVGCSGQRMLSINFVIVMMLTLNLSSRCLWRHFFTLLKYVSIFENIFKYLSSRGLWRDEDHDIGGSRLALAPWEGQGFSSTFTLKIFEISFNVFTHVYIFF